MDARATSSAVMTGLGPGIHVFVTWFGNKTWMARTSLAMTT
jgi:hypothetical protein